MSWWKLIKSNKWHVTKEEIKKAKTKRKRKILERMVQNGKERNEKKTRKDIEVKDGLSGRETI